MSTLVLWALAVLVILICKWSGGREPRTSRREQAGHFWLWEHEETREVSHE